jgi:hypothetical protein
MIASLIDYAFYHVDILGEVEEGLHIIGKVAVNGTETADHKHLAANL